MIPCRKSLKNLKIKPLPSEKKDEKNNYRI